MIPILIFGAAVFAYPARWAYRLSWIIIGYFTLTITNIFRLAMVAYLVEKQADFPFYHDLLGNILLMTTGLLLFYLFLRGTIAHYLTR